MDTETKPTQTLWSLIVERYLEAQAQRASASIETNVATLPDTKLGVNFILQVAAALRDKPKPKSHSTGDKRDWQNPFLPYDPALWVEHLSDTHTLLLNKFNVVAHHVLVVTRQFESQLDPLGTADMEATWAVVQSMPEGGMAFYNCGPESGASQPHKHVQVVPLPLGGPAPAGSTHSVAGPPIWAAMAPSLEGAAPGEVVDLTALPFAAFAVKLPPDVTPSFLADAAASLLDRCRHFLGAPPPPPPAQPQPLEQGEAPPGLGPVPLSYNLLLTRRFLLLVPRRRETVGPVSCNSVAFAGSFFVRSREELEFVKGVGPAHVLAEVGFPWQR